MKPPGHGIGKKKKESASGSEWRRDKTIMFANVANGTLSEYRLS